MGALHSHFDATMNVGRARACCRALFDSSSVGYVSLDANGTILEINAAAARMLGVRENVIGERLESFFAEARRKQLRAAVENAFAGRRECLELQVDGRILELDIGAGGHPPSHGAILVDVTGPRLTEARVRETERLAHDFRNLLTVILVHTSFAFDATDLADARSDIAIARTAAERAAALCEQLLDVSQRPEPRVELTDVDAIVDEVLTMSRRLVDARISFLRSPAPRPVRVMIEPARLQQAVMNLVLNARDAISGPGTISVETTIDAGETRRWVRVAVTDTGSGMDAATLARAFEPFFTTKPLGQGSGIGLATVHALVEQSGGRISVSSEIGKGTSFVICLPDATDKTILVVDDQPELGTAMRRALGSAGYRVLVSTSAEEALRIAASDEKLDLVCMDVTLPVMSGPELAARIQELRPGITIAFMSGHARSDVAKNELVARAAFISKPFALHDLLEQVHALIAAAAR